MKVWVSSGVSRSDCRDERIASSNSLGDARTIVTGPSVLDGSTAVVMPADHGDTTTASRTGDEAREEVLWTAVGHIHTRSVGPCGAGAFGLGLLGGLPSGKINDGEVLNLLGDPHLRRIGAGLALAGRGVLDKPLAVPDQAAKVELIVEDPCAARS